MPVWLHIVAWVSLIVCFLCAGAIAVDEFARPQKMWIMNVVWPVNALYLGPLALWAYWRWGRPSTAPQGARPAGHGGEEHPSQSKPFWVMAAIGTSHCGAGCTLGDIIAEWLMFCLGLNFFDARRHHELFTAYVLDYAFAYVLGIAFQYFTIAPMRNLGLGAGLWAAIKADTLALTAFEVGLFGWMALTTLVLFRHPPEMTDPVYWFMMQIGMALGFVTAYPVNAWLLKKGLKEAM
ncbi:MAG: Membrane protein [Phycisphaerales bacterium]|nr:Membrane protein [Phycisphaerales bacterium]